MRPVTLAALGTLLSVMTARARKIPTGFCTDKQGKRRAPRPPCDANGKGPYLGPGRDGKPMHAPCDRITDCVPEAIHDPATATLHSLGLAMAALGAVMTLAKGERW